jgi:hypothetical protein
MLDITVCTYYVKSFACFALVNKMLLEHKCVQVYQQFIKACFIVCMHLKHLLFSPTYISLVCVCLFNVLVLTIPCTEWHGIYLVNAQHSFDWITFASMITFVLLDKAFQQNWLMSSHWCQFGYLNAAHILFKFNLLHELVYWCFLVGFRIPWFLVNPLLSAFHNHLLFILLSLVCHHLHKCCWGWCIFKFSIHISVFNMTSWCAICKLWWWIWASSLARRQNFKTFTTTSNNWHLNCPLKVFLWPWPGSMIPDWPVHLE